tara:strand:- start:300 stop:509 length:210 start_codon:yes stop_codon:yes gene_type:complete
MKKPESDNVLVTYDDYDKTWYPAKILDRLSTQFTCEFLIQNKLKHGFYFYKDNNVTWKSSRLKRIERKD